MKRTPFGTMLSHFRFQKKMAIEKAERDMLARTEEARTKYGNIADGYEIRQSEVHAQDGSTVTKLELWQRIDVERVKISTSVVAETLKDDDKVEVQKDDDWGL